MRKVGCSIRGCEREALARGWCRIHYYRWHRTGDPLQVNPIRDFTLSTAERFWLRVDKKGPLLRGNGRCWVWKGARLSDGYGHLMVAGRSYRAHRWSYEQNFGPIPPGLSVLHRCDSPPCVNPSHLFLGTQVDNMRDSAAKGRQGHPGEKNGRAKLTAANVAAIRAAATGRYGERSELARQYGISSNQIGLILDGRSW